MKYTPRLEVILKELNLSIPSFRIIYCAGDYRPLEELVVDAFSMGEKEYCPITRTRRYSPQRGLQSSAEPFMQFLAFLGQFLCSLLILLTF